MNYRDVDVLDRSFSGLANTVLQNRMLAEQQQDRAASRQLQGQDLQLRRDQLAQEKTYEQDRLAETKRHNTAVEGTKDEGHVNAWLKGPQGGIMEFTGPQSSLDKILANGQASGKPLQVVDKPQTPDAFATVTKDTAFGKMTFHAKDADELQKITGELAKYPAAPPSASGPADVQTDAAAADLEDKAAKATDAATKKTLLARAAALRSGIGRPDPGDYSEETDVIERDDEGRPSKTVKRRVKADAGAAGGQGVKPLALPETQKDLQQGKVYSTARGPATWNGSQFVPIAAQ